MTKHTERNRKISEVKEQTDLLKIVINSMFDSNLFEDSRLQLAATVAELDQLMSVLNMNLAENEKAS